MALYSTPDLRRITAIPHEREFRHVSAGMSPAEHQAVEEELWNRVGAADADPPPLGDGQIITSSWVPGADWSNTPFDPIYRASNGDKRLAGRIFGIFLWKVIMEHPQAWSFGRYELEGRPIE